MYKTLRKTPRLHIIIMIIMFTIVGGLFFGIDTAARGSYITGADIFCFIVAGVLLIGDIYCLLYLIIGMDIAPIKKEMKTNGWEPESVEQDLLSGHTYKNILVGQKYVAYSTWGRCYLYAISDVLWVYPFTRTGAYKVYGIKFKEFVKTDLYITTRNKKRCKIVMQSAEEAQNVVKDFQQSHSHILLEYSEEINLVFENDFDQLVRLSEQKGTAAQ